MKTDYHQQTQAYSTWGDKLLQHTDRLHDIQKHRVFRPITLQLAPTEACDSDCPFCSVGNRPKGKIPFSDVVSGVNQFAELGCKSVEITGGGNPLIYRDGDKTINDVINVCHVNGLKIGVITNTEVISRHMSKESVDKCSWIRVSLAKLDEGFGPDDYDLSAVTDGKLGLSYIVHTQTTPKTFEMMKAIVEKYPAVKFVRVAADCLTHESVTFKDKWGDLISSLGDKFFIKEINDNYHAFQGGCWVGMLRPYWTSTGIYICTSHVLMKRTYLPEYKLCDWDGITEAWESMNARFKAGKNPYEIDVSSCGNCYYKNNNQLLSTVLNELPDKDFA